MVEKLSKYNVEICHCFLGEHMETIESSDGEFFKVEDVEPILNSLQQLKAKIPQDIMERLEAVQCIVASPCNAEEAKCAWDELDSIIAELSAI